MDNINKIKELLNSTYEKANSNETKEYIDEVASEYCKESIELLKCIITKKMSVENDNEKTALLYCFYQSICNNINKMKKINCADFINSFKESFDSWSLKISQFEKEMAEKNKEYNTFEVLFKGL